jgi:NAD(P)-dependent dehydrogenase (short-subunit alcohol dehydrogenase family)
MVAVITGAAGGIGEGLARAAADRGMKLVLADIDSGSLDALVAALTADGTQALAIPTDVTDPAALDRLFAATIARFGQVDMLINNAGIEMLGNAWELSVDQWERIVRINVLGVVHGVRAFGAHMAASGRRAHIANVASIGGFGMMPVQTPYIMSKHAVLSFTECLFLEFQRTAPLVKVSAILPGPVATDIFRDAPGGSNPANVDHHRAAMSTMLDAHGMSPREAGTTILTQVLEGRFWVSTHPEMMREAAAKRAAHLAELDDPFLNSDADRILGPAEPIGRPA